MKSIQSAIGKPAADEIDIEHIKYAYPINVAVSCAIILCLFVERYVPI